MNSNVKWLLFTAEKSYPQIVGNYVKTHDNKDISCVLIYNKCIKDRQDDRNGKKL